MSTPNQPALSDREILIERTFDAPRKKVWAAWTDVKHLAHWWGPDGFTITTREIAFAPGGAWRFIMHGPNGMNFPNRIVYQEIVEPERLVYLHDSDQDNDPDQFMTTVTFAERGGRTDVAMLARFASAATRDMHVEKYGAIEGGKQTLGRLAGYLMTL
jgi:uncharacterized protein YndB with AHSA1/START domain